MDEWKSVVLAHNSWILGWESDDLEGSNWGSFNEAWVIIWDWHS